MTLKSCSSCSTHVTFLKFAGMDITCFHSQQYHIPEDASLTNVSGKDEGW